MWVAAATIDCTVKEFRDDAGGMPVRVGVLQGCP